MLIFILINLCIADILSFAACVLVVADALDKEHWYGHHSLLLGSCAALFLCTTLSIVFSGVLMSN